MKRLTFTLLALFFTATVVAQVEDDWKDDMKKSREDAVDEFEKFRQQANNEFEDFRRKANEDYARFMEEAWKMYNVMAADEIPLQPKPVQPLEEVAPVTNSKIEYGEVIESPSHRLPKTDLSLETDLPDVSQPEPMEPIVSSYESSVAVQSLSFYGSFFPVRVEASKEKPYKLKDVKEKSVAKMWKKLSRPYYDNVVAECLQQRKDYNLCDWAYVKLAEQMSNKYFEKGSNEAVVLQMYILIQSGYQMRMARAEDKLLLLMGSKERIYRYKYFIMDNVKYYILDRSMQDKSMYVYDHEFPNEKLLSLVMKQPKIEMKKTEKKTFDSKNYPELKVSIETNKNLIDFYDEYPVCGQWCYYSEASLSDGVKQKLYPVLQQAIEGKSEVEATNILLDFVQTGFNYASDEVQFGYERPLYPDETLFYPYCDCEDRSILFSCLVRELIGLDVVLLDYPGHLTTAVHFNGKVNGDYLLVDGEKYVICEPTLVCGAPVGISANKYKGIKPNVIKF